MFAGATELPSLVDVAIIGGGYTGLNAARVLAHSGASVAVLESRSIGWGASSRNGGLATTGIKKPVSAIFRQYGSALGREFWQASLDAIDLIGDLVRDEGLKCDYTQRGHVALAWKPGHFQNMLKSVSWYKNNLGYEVRAVAASDLRGEIGTDAFHGGLVDEHSASVHPAKYVY